MRRQTFILIMVVYFVIAAVLSFLMAPSALGDAQSLADVMHVAPMRYYVVGLLTTGVLIPAYAARLMDLAIRPLFAALFLFPVCFNLAQKSGTLTFSDDAYPQTLMNMIGLCNLLVQAWLMIRRGSKGPNRYGPDPVIEKA
jgi:uncharacterized membrane protein YhaH (DUF805 family)